MERDRHNVEMRSRVEAAQTRSARLARLRHARNRCILKLTMFYRTTHDGECEELSCRCSVLRLILNDRKD